jgi:hypothetical protein
VIKTIPIFIGIRSTPHAAKRSFFGLDWATIPCVDGLFSAKLAVKVCLELSRQNP